MNKKIYVLCFIIDAEMGSWYELGYFETRADAELWLSEMKLTLQHIATGYDSGDDDAWESSDDTYRRVIADLERLADRHDQSIDDIASDLTPREIYERLDIREMHLIG